MEHPNVALYTVNYSLCAGQTFEFNVSRYLHFVNSTLSLHCQHRHCYPVLACGCLHPCWSFMLHSYYLQNYSNLSQAIAVHQEFFTELASAFDAVINNVFRVSKERFPFCVVAMFREEFMVSFSFTMQDCLHLKNNCSCG